MESALEIISVPVIAGIVYFVMAVYKTLVKNAPAIWTSLIPMWAAVLGAVLGVVAFYVVPEIVPAENVLVAIFIGMSSGLAATGTNQVFKQIKKSSESETTESK